MASLLFLYSPKGHIRNVRVLFRFSLTEKALLVFTDEEPVMSARLLQCIALLPSIKNSLFDFEMPC